MRALLLSAGLGTRLKPITKSIPKCLVPINSKPLLQYWLENLSKVGIDEFIINTHYKSQQVEEFIESSIYKNRVTLVYEKELLNTGGTVLACKELLKDETFMLVHSDNLSFCDFNQFINSHKLRDKKCDITMMLFKTDTPSLCGIVELNDVGIVQNFFEKRSNPPSNLANAAVYICEPAIFKVLESFNTKKLDFSLDIVPKYMGKINTFLNDVYHRDIGNIESYNLAQIEIKSVLH